MIPKKKPIEAPSIHQNRRLDGRRGDRPAGPDGRRLDAGIPGPVIIRKSEKLGTRK